MILKSKKGSSLLFTIMIGLLISSAIVGVTIWLMHLNKASVETEEKMTAISYAYNKIISYQSSEYSSIKALQNTENTDNMNGYLVTSTFGSEEDEYGVKIIPVTMTVTKDNKPLYTYVYERRSDDTEYYTNTEINTKYNQLNDKLNVLIDKSKQVNNKIAQINAHNQALDNLNDRIITSNANIDKSNAQVEAYNERATSIHNGDFLIKKENAGNKYYPGTCDVYEIGYCLTNYNL